MARRLSRLDATLGELNIMLQKAGTGAWKKGEDQILQITSRVEIRRGGVRQKSELVRLISSLSAPWEARFFVYRSLISLSM